MATEFTDLDDLEDLPGFEALLTGSYMLVTEEITPSFKIQEKTAAKFSYTINEVMEVTEAPNDGAAPPKTGDKAEFVYMMDNEFGRGFAKKLYKVYAERLGVTNIAQIAEQGKGLVILAVVKRTWNKDKQRHFSQIATAAVI